MMDEIALARGLHILGVVLWIGGVSMVTTILLPVVRRFKSANERVDFFEAVESRFAWQARVTTLLTGLSGFYMLEVLDGWDRYQSLSYWWLHAMTAVWVLFTLMLFILEPFFLHRWFKNKTKTDAKATFARIQTMHYVLLTISLITIFGAVLGSHGLLFFN
jgi:uncharacterized membrane protein